LKVKNNRERNISIEIKKIYLGNTTLKQTRNDQNVLFIPEDTSVDTILAHVILEDLDSFGK